MGLDTKFSSHNPRCMLMEYFLLFPQGAYKIVKEDKEGGGIQLLSSRLTWKWTHHYCYMDKKGCVTLPCRWGGLGSNVDSLLRKANQSSGCCCSFLWHRKQNQAHLCFLRNCKELARILTLDSACLEFISGCAAVIDVWPRKRLASSLRPLLHFVSERWRNWKQPPYRAVAEAGRKNA